MSVADPELTIRVANFHLPLSGAHSLVREVAMKLWLLDYFPSGVPEDVPHHELAEGAHQNLKVAEVPLDRPGQDRVVLRAHRYLIEVPTSTRPMSTPRLGNSSASLLRDQE